MYYRTNYRLGNGVVRIMSWVMRVKTPAVKLSHLLAAIWLSFLLFYQAPTAVHMACRALEMGGRTNERRTPKKSRPWQRLDNFADVRARIREQRESPEQ